MTDKEVIMIDDVNVAGCEFYQGATLDAGYCHQELIPCNQNYPYEHLCSTFPNCNYKQLQRKEQECEELKGQLEPAAEMCPHCGVEVELPPYLGIYECLNCGKLIVACSMCENKNCTNCKYRIDEELRAEKQKVQELQAYIKEDLAPHAQRLQAENEELKNQLQNPEVQVALSDVRTGERELWYKKGVKSDHYKQALNKVKKLADKIAKINYDFLYESCNGNCNKKQKDNNLSCRVCIVNEILIAINEVLKDE